MSKNKFKVGDRVRVYDRAETYVGVVEMCLSQGEMLIKTFGPRDENNFIVHDFHWVHYKQCRKLKPKKKAPPLNNRDVLIKTEWGLKKYAWSTAWWNSNDENWHMYAAGSRIVYLYLCDVLDWIELPKEGQEK